MPILFFLQLTDAAIIFYQFIANAKLFLIFTGI